MEKVVGLIIDVEGDQEKVAFLENQVKYYKAHQPNQADIIDYMMGFKTELNAHQREFYKKLQRIQEKMFKSQSCMIKSHCFATHSIPGKPWRQASFVGRVLSTSLIKLAQ